VAALLLATAALAALRLAASVLAARLLVLAAKGQLHLAVSDSERAAGTTREDGGEISHVKNLSEPSHGSRIFGHVDRGGVSFSDDALPLTNAHRSAFTREDLPRSFLRVAQVKT